MSKVLSDLLYTKEHEWVLKLDGNKVRIGITDFAQSALGDIVFIELPEIGTEVSANDSMGSVESVKSVSDIYAPVAGTVSAVNGALEDAPEQINADPYGEGWIAEFELSGELSPEGLLTPEEYDEYTKEEE